MINVSLPLYKQLSCISSYKRQKQLSPRPLLKFSMWLSTVSCYYVVSLSTMKGISEPHQNYYLCFLLTVIVASVSRNSEVHLGKNVLFRHYFLGCEKSHCNFWHYFQQAIVPSSRNKYLRNIISFMHTRKGKQRGSITVLVQLTKGQAHLTCHQKGKSFCSVPCLSYSD